HGRLPDQSGGSLQDQGRRGGVDGHRYARPLPGKLPGSAARQRSVHARGLHGFSTAGSRAAKRLPWGGDDRRIARQEPQGESRNLVMNTKSNNLGFARIATACPKLRVADCKFNAAEHVKLLAEAESKGVSVLVFPELSLTGYTCGDLFQQEALLDGAVEALHTVLKATTDVVHGLAFVGLPLVVHGPLFNCAAVLCNGRILGLVPKSFPPTYKEFYESRWFRPAASAHSQWIDLLGRQVAFGSDLL